MTEENSQNETPQKDVVTLDTGSEPVPELPGERLMLAREESHLSREEIGQHLHLDVKLIEALELNDYAKLPAPSYICGYLRSYARLLKLPEIEIVNSYTQGEEISSALLPENVDIVSKKQPGSSFFMPILVLILILFGLFAAIWLLDVFNKSEVNVSGKVNTETNSTPKHFSSVDDSGTTSDSSPPFIVHESIDNSTQPVIDVTEPAEITEFKKNNLTEAEEATPDAITTTLKTGASILQLSFKGDSWTEVNDASGSRLIYKLIVEGSNLELDGEPPFVILLGNAPVVKVLYKGNEFNHRRFHRDNIAYFRIGSSN